jgi:hypothetical protein
VPAFRRRGVSHRIAAGTETVLVVLNVAPGREEAVIDWLLGREAHEGFTSTTVFGHRSRHEGLSTAEQVRGRRRRTQFEIHMSGESAGDFLLAAHEEFGAADIHCMVLPALAAGSLAAICQALSA